MGLWHRAWAITIPLKKQIKKIPSQAQSLSDLVMCLDRNRIYFCYFDVISLEAVNQIVHWWKSLAKCMEQIQSFAFWQQQTLRTFRDVFYSHELFSNLSFEGEKRKKLIFLLQSRNKRNSEVDLGVYSPYPSVLLELMDVTFWLQNTLCVYGSSFKSRIRLDPFIFLSRVAHFSVNK